jgi:hypothetical protein
VGQPGCKGRSIKEDVLRLPLTAPQLLLEGIKLIPQCEDLLFFFGETVCVGGGGQAGAGGLLSVQKALITAVTWAGFDKQPALRPSCSLKASSWPHNARTLSSSLRNLQKWGWEEKGCLMF